MSELKFLNAFETNPICEKAGYVSTMQKGH